MLMQSDLFPVSPDGTVLLFLSRNNNRSLSQIRFLISLVFVFPFSSLFEKSMLSKWTVGQAGNLSVLLIRKQLSGKLLAGGAPLVTNVSRLKRAILSHFEVVKLIA